MQDSRVEQASTQPVGVAHVEGRFTLNHAARRGSGGTRLWFQLARSFYRFSLSPANAAVVFRSVSMMSLRPARLLRAR